MRSRSAVEIARASLALAYPQATEDGLDRAAQLIVRWSSEGVGERLDSELTELLLQDLQTITESPVGIRAVDERRSPAAAPERRVWRRASEIPPPQAPGATTRA
ncbi:hypothetical protein ACFVZH_23935 [Streptomyces sp. NPDC059534]|uniref:hypothetical protein n=1 Tax=Streptomyces sp. NPDC059534 TaxID=3346859 RepID=UPI0036D15915